MKAYKKIEVLKSLYASSFNNFDCSLRIYGKLCVSLVKLGKNRIFLKKGKTVICRYSTG